MIRRALRDPLAPLLISALLLGGCTLNPATGSHQLNFFGEESGMAQMQVTDAQDAGHAWAEALVDNFGWVGFDPANGVSPTDAYVRVAVGLDYLGAAPVRGTRYGGLGETLSVKVVVHDSGRGGR